MTDLKVGDYVKDIPTVNGYETTNSDDDMPGDGLMVVVDVHQDTPPDKFTVTTKSGESIELSEIAGDEWTDYMDEGYEPSEDFVIETVYAWDLDNRFTGEWVTWEPGKLKELCEKNGVTVYSYHSGRLTESVPMNVVD